MVLRGIQEYIARDVNNIARVEDEGNIVSIEGNIFLFPPKKSHPILYIIGQHRYKYAIQIFFTDFSIKLMLKNWTFKMFY